MHYVPLTPPPPLPQTTAIFRTLRKSTALYKAHNMGLRYIKIYAIPAAFSSPLINEDLQGQAATLFTFDNRFRSTGWAVPQSVRLVQYILFRLQVSYLSAISHTGRTSCRVKSLYMKRFGTLTLPPRLPPIFFFPLTSVTSKKACTGRAVRE
jgi:hypothetical protein